MAASPRAAGGRNLVLRNGLGSVTRAIPPGFRGFQIPDAAHEGRDKYTMKATAGAYVTVIFAKVSFNDGTPPKTGFHQSYVYYVG